MRRRNRRRRREKAGGRKVRQIEGIGRSRRVGGEEGGRTGDKVSEE